MQADLDVVRLSVKPLVLDGCDCARQALIELTTVTNAKKACAALAMDSVAGRDDV